MVLIYESNQTNNETYIESRTYLDIKSGTVLFYQYTFKNNKVINTNCVEIPIKQFGPISKNILKSYLLLDKYG